MMFEYEPLTLVANCGNPEITRRKGIIAGKQYIQNAGIITCFIIKI